MQTRFGIWVWWWVMDQSILVSGIMLKSQWRASPGDVKATYPIALDLNTLWREQWIAQSQLGTTTMTISGCLARHQQTTDSRQQTRPLSKFLTSLVLNHSSQIILNSFASTTRTRIAIRLQIRTKGVWEGRKNRLVVHIVFLISLKRNIAVFSRSLTSNVQY